MAAPSPPPPPDRTRREHIAAVDRVVFQTDDRTFCILALADGLVAVGPGPADQFVRGIQYRFMGKWTDDPRHGFRFRYTTHTTHQPAGKAGLVRYLTQLCDDIGERRAEKLWSAYGPDTLNQLRTGEPESVAERTGVPLSVVIAAGKSLRENAAEEATRVDLYDLFAGRGFPAKLLPRVVQKWGARAPAVIRRNPFALLGLPGGGFRRCDRMYLDLGLPPAALKRAALGLWDLLRTDRNGNTWLPAERAAAQLRDRIPGSDLLAAARLAVRGKLVRARRDRGGIVHLAEARRAYSEELAAAHLSRLMSAESLWPVSLPASERDGDGLPSAHQVERWRQATVGPVGILCGGPGTGKSHTLGYALREIVAGYGRSAVACCAPTGKAANRFTEALGLAGVSLRATTIHTLLEIGRNGHDGDGWGFRRNAHNPLDARFVVVDEMSMVDADLIASLLDALADGTHLLLVGDPYQLPPVGHGAPLRDLLAARLPVGELTQVRRNAGQIVHACVRIKAGELFEFSSVIDLDANPTRNLRVIQCRDEESMLANLDGLLAAGGRFDPVWQTQVVVARNQGAGVGRKELNARLHKMLNPAGVAARDCPWLVGDKVICLRNTLLEVVGPIDTPEPTDATEYYPARDDYGNKRQVYTANGEIGRVLAVGPGQAVCRFSERDELVTVRTKAKSDADDDPDAGDEGKDEFDHAYAVTGHKMQGSQAPFVIIVLDHSSLAVANREWIYTAVSRASRACVILTAPGVIPKAVGRVGLVRRKTFLADRVNDALTECVKGILYGAPATAV